MGTRFQNPQNDYVEEVSGLVWLWTLLFGTIYFAVKGVWGHVFISLILAILTGGLSWFVYPFFARRIIENSYRKTGWKELTAPASGVSEPAPTQHGGLGRLVFKAAGIIVGLWIVAAVIWAVISGDGGDPAEVAVVNDGKLATDNVLADDPSKMMQAARAWIDQVERFNKAAEEFAGECDPITKSLRKLIPLQRRMQAMALRGPSLSAEEKQALGADIQGLFEQFTQNLYVVGTACGNDSEFSNLLKQM